MELEFGFWTHDRVLVLELKVLVLVFDVGCPLHWLPVRRRMDFKMATLVYLSLFGNRHGSSHLVCEEGRRQLRSATLKMCPCETNTRYKIQVFCSCRSDTDVE